MDSFVRKEEELKSRLQRPILTAVNSSGITELLPNGQTSLTPQTSQFHHQYHLVHHQHYNTLHHAPPTSPRVLLPPPTGGFLPLVPPGDSPPVSAPISGVEYGDYFLPSVKEHPSLSSQPLPKSPVRLSGSARVHLGDHGHTVVQTKKGITAREALARPMKLRKLAPETCAFYRVSDPQKVSQWDITLRFPKGLWV